MMRSLRLLTLAATLCITASCSGFSAPDPHPCDGVICSGKGSCAVLNEQPTCSCELGYEADSINGLSCVPVGAASTDAGTPAADTGGSAQDAGASITDLGATPSDAGAASGDAAAGSDAGVSEEDAGSGSDDAGAAPDAGGVPAESCQAAHCRGDNETQPGEGVICVENQYTFFPSQSATPELEDRLTRSQPVPGEPVVTDALSQLVWTGCALGLSGADCQNGTRNNLANDAYDQACEGLNWGGFDDWVRPNGWLLNSLIDRRFERPALNEQMFPNWARFDGGEFTPVRRHPTSSLYLALSFKEGETVFTNSSSTNLLCVRSATNAPVQPTVRRCFESTFGVAAAPTTTDPSTGLVWQSCVAGLAGPNCNSGSTEEKDWQSAYDYCEDLEWAGSDDWRLPSLDQMQSMMGALENGRDTLPTDGFGIVNSGSLTFWTRTQRPRYGNKVFMTFRANDSKILGRQLASYSYVRCVRGDRWSDEITYPERVCQNIRPIRHAGLRSGDDLQLSRAESASPGELIVTDSYNGVQWTGCLLGQSGTNCEHGSATRVGNNFPSVCSNLTWGGHDDWRMARMNEVRSLIDYSIGNQPPVSQGVLAAFPFLDAYSALSADNELTRYRPGYTIAFNAYGSPYPANQTRNFLCVRDHGEQPPREISRCLETTAWSRSEGTVTDARTGVEWMACDHGVNGRGCANGAATSSNFSAAQDTCERLSWAGHDDWRLPTHGEALGMMDSSHYYRVKLDHRAIPFHSATTGYFVGWTSSPSRETGQFYRQGTFYFNDQSANATANFRCVRSLD